MTNNDWFDSFQKGDERAFRSIFDLYYRPVRFFASKIIRDEIYAEDIVSESFRKAWDRRAIFGAPKHVENFLYLSARNACINHLRDQNRKKRTVEELIQLSRQDSENEQPIDLERVEAQVMEKIYEKLQQLPHGDVLRMSYLEGKSTGEIAAMLETSEDNVRTLKSRSLKAIRKLLAATEWLLFICSTSLFAAILQ